MRRENAVPGTELHCHILPGVDDGAKDLTDTLNLLDREKEQGVKQIAFTPHFYADRMELADFLERRKTAEDAVKIPCERRGISFLCGAEVRMVPELLDMDLKDLALADTGYFLLEWPFYGFPIWGDEVVDKIYATGNTPIFAHIERYDYFTGSLDRLIPYLEDGVLMQVNAGSLLKKETQKQVLRLIRAGYVQLIASDAHNLDHRPPLLSDAYEVVSRKLGEKTAVRLKENADDVFHGQVPDASLGKRGRRS